MNPRYFIHLLILGILAVVRADAAPTTTTIVNYSFNGGSSFATLTPVLTPGITSTASGTQPFQLSAGTATDASAFTTNNVPGTALFMFDSSGTNTKYFQFQLGGPSLVLNENYKVYVQGSRTASGATTITLAYSTNGTTFTNVSETLSPGLGSFNSKVFDLSSIPELDHRNTIYFRLLVSGAPNPNPGLAIDNFQVQADTVSCPSSLTVNSTADTSDAAPGDGSCDDGAGNCTLRAALEESQALTFCGATININFTVNGIINLGSSLPTINRPVNLNGPGANSLAIAGNGSFRLLNILLSTPGTMAINDLTFTRGGRGAGENATAVEFNNNGTLNLNRIEFVNNSGGSGSSVIFSNASAALNINSCSIHHNPVEHVLMLGNTPFAITNSTISNNTGGTGAAIFVFGGTVNSSITGSTIANNNQGLWHVNTSVPSTVTLRNSIFSQNGNINLRRTGSGTCAENGILSGGYNLIDNDPGTSLCNTDPNDLIGTSFNPQLSALGYYGGTTQSRPPALTSPVIDKGKSFALTTDQRGSGRPRDIQGVASASGGDGADIGAVEAGLIVNSLADTGDASPDGVCNDGNGNCTLREALQEASFMAGADTITFNVTGTINLSSSLPMITQPVNIVGPGANVLAISGNSTFRLLNILLSTPSTMAISDLTFTRGGKGAGENATALEFNNNGTLNLNRVEFLNNSGGSGSSVIFSNASAALNINSCSIHHNPVEHVLMLGNTPFAITNSTISNNTGGTGAAIFVFGGTINSTITGSTIAFNNQGLWHVNTTVPSTVTLRNSIFSQNGNINLRRTGSGTCAENGILSGGYNLIDNDPGSSLCNTEPADLIGTSFNPRLTPPGNYGGPTRTLALLAGSAALDKGKSFGLTMDQRGQARPFDDPTLPSAAGGDQSDIGAFELQSACNPISISPASLPNWNTSRAYNQTLTASGGNAPYTFTIVEGALPSGLTLSASGALTGTPSATGTSNFTVLATDAAGCFGLRSYAVTISECTAISLGPATLPNGAPNVPYSGSITASGGIAPYTYTASGTLPTGLLLSSAGLLSGTPTSAGVFNFSVTATSNNNGCQGTQNYQIIINAPPSDISLSNASVPENSASGTAIGTFNTTDPDNSSFVYTLVPGSGSTDNAAFTISGDQLLTNAVFDFETKSSYGLRVRSTDQAGLFFEMPFSIIVTNVNEAPTISDIPNQTITMGSTTGALAFTISDPETTSLTVTGSSDNPSLVPSDAVHITFAGTGANRTVTITPAAQQVGTARITITVSDGTLTATDEFEVMVGSAVTAGQVQISEFRFRGPDSDGEGPLTASANEFIELYNTTNADIVVSASDGSSGWALVAADGVTRFVIPNGTMIPALGHFLAANTAGYGLTSYAAGDSSYTLDIPDDSGIALFNSATSFNLATRLDAVGFANLSDPLYREGTGLTPSGGITADSEIAFFRQFVNGVHSDTDNNNTDFQFVSTDGGTYNGRRSLLGAPGPQGTSSPRNSNTTILVTMLDPAVAPSAVPNRVRDLTSNPAGNATFGTMSIRRRVTNNTGLPVSILRFRVIDITALPTDTITADVRAINSTDTSAVLSNTSVVQVLGTTLETPPAQPLAGGLNSTLKLSEPLAPGASINVQFLLGVQRSGAFRFYINVEAVPEKISASLR